MELNQQNYQQPRTDYHQERLEEDVWKSLDQAFDEGETAVIVDFEAMRERHRASWYRPLELSRSMPVQPPTRYLRAAGLPSDPRGFLENIASEIVELNRADVDGLLRVKGNYSRFLEKKEGYLEVQGKRQDSLANRVHTELEWLRRGPKARRTKAKARIDKAHEMIGELADLNARRRTATAKIDFSATDRQTKQLIALDGVTYAIGNRTLFEGLSFTVRSGMRVGLVGQME